MQHFSKQPEETVEEYMQRSNSFVKHFLREHDIQPWDEAYHTEVFKWAGTLVKIQLNDPERYTCFQSQGLVMDSNCCQTEWRTSAPRQVFQGLALGTPSLQISG